MSAAIYDGRADFLQLFATQLTMIAVRHVLNTWNDKDFNKCIRIHLNTAKYN